MTQDKTAHGNQNWRISTEANLALTHYALLGLTPLATVQEIRRAYRELSKLYHPDTTDLPREIAIQKFQQLNEAYVTLSTPEHRLTYDQKISSQLHGVQPAETPRPAVSQVRSTRVSPTYVDSGDLRPLSPGELFALFILGITFLACLTLAIIVGVTRSETVFQPALGQSPAITQPAATSPNDQPAENDPPRAEKERLLPVDHPQDTTTPNDSA